MPVKLNSTGGGSVTLTTPSTASDYTVTMPAATGTAALTASPTFTGTTTTGAQSVGGNITFSAADAGIIFNKTGALTNSTLNDYETGTWTPVCANSGLTAYTSSGNYIKVGTLVWVFARFTLTTVGTASGQLTFTGLPFTSGIAYQLPNLCREVQSTGNAFQVFINPSASTGQILTLTNGAITWTNGYVYAFYTCYSV